MVVKALEIFVLLNVDKSIDLVEITVDLVAISAYTVTKENKMFSLNV